MKNLGPYQIEPPNLEPVAWPSTTRHYSLEWKDRYVKTDDGYRVNPEGTNYRVRCQCGAASEAFKFPEVKVVSDSWIPISGELPEPKIEWHKLPMAHQFMREHVCKSA